MKAITNKTKTAPQKQRLSTIAAIIFLFGNVVGVGVFFKTGSIYGANDGNAYGTMISWVIGFIIALSTCVCLGEVASVKVKKHNSGLAGWMETLCGKKMGRFATVFLALGYFAFIAMALSFFAADGFCFFMTAFFPNDTDIWLGQFWVIFLVSIVFLAIFWVFNTFKPHMATQIAKYGSMFKFIPILTIVLAGLIYGIAKGQGGLFTTGPSSESGLSGNLGLGCLAAVPAVLFAFNGFSGAGAISSKLDNPRKQLPKILSFGMILVGIVYVFVALAQLLSGATSAFGLFGQIFANNSAAAEVFTGIISFFIFACALISTDCLTLAAVSSTQAAIEENKFAFSNKLLHKTRNHESMAGGIIVLATWLLFMAIIYIPSAVFNTDAIIDGATNTCTEISFVMYGIAILGSMINRKTKKVEVTKFRFQIPLGILAVVCCIGIAGYSTIYSFIILPIIDPHGSTSWGLFMSSKFNCDWAIGSIFFWAFTIVSLGLPFLNDLLIKMTDKNYSEKLLWEK